MADRFDRLHRRHRPGHDRNKPAVPPKGPVPAKPAVPADAGGGSTSAIEVLPEATPAPTTAKPAVPVPPQAVPAKPVVPAAPQAVPAKPVAAARPVEPKPAAPVPLAKPSAPAAAPSRDPLVGRTVARCRIEASIGAGKTSRVYRAIHTALDAPVAVKVLLPEVLKFPTIVAKFEQEARAIAKLDHPNVVKIYDVSAEADLHCIVMELLEGEDVLDVIERMKRIDVLDAMRIVRQAAAGLQAAHAKGIIHRDVKPQNLFLLPDGTVKLVDFGLATQAEGELATERIGTPHYMAPEVCEAKSAEPASDIYSLGITFYHLLTGAPPYAGLSIKEILQAHVECEPLHPERKRPELSKAICDLLRAMTKRDPLTRPDAQAVIDTLDQIGGAALRKKLRIRPSHALRAGARRSNAGLFLVGLGALVVIGVLVAALSKTTPKPPSKPPDSGGYGSLPPTPPPSVPPPTPPVPPTPPDGTTPGGMEGVDVPPPPPAAETEEQKKAREKREKEAKAAKALEEATDYARAQSENVPLVVAKYKEVADAWKGTDAGKEARRRWEGIQKGEIHPHPDKTFDSGSTIARARAALGEAQPKIEAAIEGWRFDEAASLVPESVDDPTGKVKGELDFWRGFTKDLVEFTRLLKRHVPEIPDADRNVKTPKGVFRVRKATETHVQVEADADLVDYRWSDLGAAETFKIAKRAFRDKDARVMQTLAAFALAFRMEEPFFNVVAPLKAMAGSGVGSEQIERMLAHATDEWFAKK